MQQKERYLPRLAAGALIAAIAITEPDAGSDIRGIRASVTACPDGYRLSGTKRYVSNGHLADLILVAATAPAFPGRIALLLVERDSAIGVRAGPILEMIGRQPPADQARPQPSRSRRGRTCRHQTGTSAEWECACPAPSASSTRWPSAEQADLHQLGGAAASDQVLALEHLVAAGKLGPGDHLLRLGQGPGVVLSAAVVQIVQSPSWARVPVSATGACS